MRCAACDRRLNDQESVRKSPITGLYYDLCNPCFATIADEVPHLDGVGSTQQEEQETEE